MAELGICATTRRYPSAAECAALGIGANDWIRLHCYSLAELDAALSVIPVEISIILNISNELAEVGHDWAGWETSMRRIAARYAGRVKIVGCGNELDLWHLQPPVGEPDPRLTPAFAAGLVKRASPILRAAGIKVAMSSVASGSWPDYLREMANRCRQAADFADLHLYVKRVSGIPEDPNWQTATAALLQAEAIAGLPVISSEAGVKVDDAGGLERQAQWASGLSALRAPLVCYFAWADDVGTPAEQGGQAFGMRGPDGRQKPVWGAMQRQFGGPVNQPPVEQHAIFQEGFAKWARLEGALIGAPLRNERGVDQGWTTQPTSTGVLNWVEGKGHCFTTHSGRIFRWQEDWPASQEVPG